MKTQEVKTKRALVAIVAFVLLTALEAMNYTYYSSFINKVNSVYAISRAIIFAAVAVILIAKKKNIYPVAISLLIARYANGAYPCFCSLFRPATTVQDIVSAILAFLFAASVLVILTVLGLNSGSEILGYKLDEGKTELFQKIYRICSYIAMLSVVLMVISSFMLVLHDKSMIRDKVEYNGNVSSMIRIYMFGYLANLLLIPAITSLKSLLMPAPRKVPAPGKAENAIYVGSEYCVSLGKHICLLIFTFGIWQLIWTYQVTKFTNADDSEPYRNPTSKLLLCLFIPFYIIYWTYKTAVRIDNIAKSRGIQSELGTVCLILAIFVPFVPPILMQDKVNQIFTTKPEDPKNDEAKAIESIEKYKALLDSGMITEEEFNAKKKQLLGI